MNYTWVSSSKEQLLFSTNRKEIELYDKYGSMACEIPMEFWDMFGELEVISKKYNKLYREHFEDLKCYALMYYDIDLYQKEIDLVYKAFFVQKEQEIIGYKNRLINDTSLKSQVVQLYYKYEPILCSYIKARRLKRLNHKIKEGTNYSYESYISIKEGKFPKVCGIEQLTDNQCEEFLISQSYIVNNRISGNVNTFPSATKLNTKKGIIENFIIPCFFSSEWGFRREIIIEYISKKFNIDILGYVNLHKKQIQKALSIKSTDIGCYSDENIKRLDEEIKRLENSRPTMMPWEDVDFRIKFDPEINKLNSLQFDLIKEGKTKEAWEVCCKRSELESSKKCKLEKKREEARIRIEERNKEIDKKINEIYKKINEIREEKRIELEREYNAIVKDLEEGVFKDEIWQSVIDNQEDLKSYLSQKYDERITTFWLKDSDDCRAYLQFRKTFDGLVETFIEQEKTGKRFLESERYANFKSMTGLLLGGEEVEEWIYNIKECFEKEWKEEEHRILKEWEEEENKRKQKMLEEEKRLEIYRFNIRNAHHRDSNIKIRQSDHTYIVNGVALDSVTNFVEGCFPKFDTEFYAEKKAAEMGVSVKSVLDMWEQKAKESRDLGTALHKRIEDYYQDITFAPNDDKAFDLFKQFANKVTLKPYRTEWAVYDLKHNIAGTIDFVDFQNGEYIIYDWKRSQKIIENGMPIKKDKYGKNGNYPLEHLDNSAYYHYALQLSLYKYILENNYGIKISDLRLGVFHPAYDKPYVLRMPYLEKEINDLFGLRSEILF